MATYSDGPTATSTTSGATLAVTGVTAAVGDLLVLFCAADNAGASGVSSTSSSITDGAGNTWTSQTATNRTAGGAASDGTTLSIWTCLVTSALVAATITLNFSPNTTSKAAAFQQVVPATGCILVVEAVGPGVAGSGTTRTSGAVSVALGTTMIGACAIETIAAITADSDTTNGSWSTALAAVATTGTDSTSQTLTVQRKTVTAAGNQTYNTGTGVAKDYALNYVLVHEAESGTVAATDAVDTAAFESIYVSGTIAATDNVDAAAFESIYVGGAMAATDAVDTASFTGLVGVVTATMAATDPPDIARFMVPTSAPRTGTTSIRILVKIDWTSGPTATTRLWDGSGPWVDRDLNIWIGAGALGNLDEVEQAINGEAATINLTLSGVGEDASGLVWQSYSNDRIIGSTVQILIQACDAMDQPVGDPEVRYTGTIDDITFRDQVADDRRVSTIEVPVVNKFTVRRLKSGSVLSDADQKARSAILNPSASPDLSCERVPGLADITLAWPHWF